MLHSHDGEEELADDPVTICGVPGCPSADYTKNLPV
jgi:hypothetical protein